MIKSLLDSEYNLENIFYESKNEKKSFQNLFSDLENLYFPSFKKNEIFPILAKNNYQTYLYFLKAIEINLPCLLIPEYLYNAEILLEKQLPFIKKQNIFDTDHPQFSYTQIEQEIKEEGTFLIRTSGSTGVPKLILHSSLNFIKKYKTRNKAFRKTLAFSPLDSIAGVETLLECLVLGKTLISRSNTYAPNHIVEIIIKNDIDYLQTTPSFLNLLILTKQVEKLSSSKLEKIDFGSEPPMPDTIKQIKNALPNIVLNHTYGMSEIGILPTKTSDSNPLLIKIDPDYSQLRIKENILYVKTETMFLRYLNHESFFDNEYFKTFDFVETHSDWLQIKGRQSEQINIGGRKFFPIELESILSLHPDIKESMVIKVTNPFVGEIVKVKIELNPTVSLDQFQENFGEFLKTNVPQFMSPQLIEFVNFESTPRMKKIRS